MSIPISQFIPPPLLGVHPFVLNVYVSISFLQTGSSVPFFYISHIQAFQLLRSIISSIVLVSSTILRNENKRSSDWIGPAAAAAAKLLQSCPTLCNPIDGSPSGSPIPGILQARTLKWVAISFSNAWKWKVKVKLLSHVRLLATPWTSAYQAPPSMGFSRQKYWSGVPLPSLTWWCKPCYTYDETSLNLVALRSPAS